MTAHCACGILDQLAHGLAVGDHRSADMRPVEAKSASAMELERFTIDLLEALRLSGYLKPASGSAADAKVRRLVRRLGIQGQDADVWLGMLRQILWKLRSSDR